MLIPFGVLSAAGAEVAGDYELIATEILTANESSIVFSNLGDYSSTYKHLQVRMVTRTVRTDINDSVGIRINGDTGSNYAYHRLIGNGSSVSSSAATSETTMSDISNAGNTFTANGFGAAVVDILDAYSASKNTTIRALSGVVGSFNNVMLNSGLFINTASITSLTLLPKNSANFLAGSRFSLYGIK
jgi:hypothetical protein